MAVLTSTHNLYFEQKYEKYQRFFIFKFSVLEVKFSIYLNRRVFVKRSFVSKCWSYFLRLIDEEPSVNNHQRIRRATSRSSGYDVETVYHAFSSVSYTITKTCLFKYTKNENFQIKKI